MDTVIDRLNTLSAGGHIPKDNPYQGYPAKLLDSLDQLHYALKILQHETDKVATAGAAGNLNVRGDTRELQGRYADILNSFNQALENIVHPVDEACDVLSAIQKHDFTVKMNGDYHGAMADLATDINETREHFLLIETVFLKLAKGDTSSLEVIRKIGRYCDADQLTPAAGDALQSVRDLITEASELAEAAQKGDLKHQADETRFAGEFKEIISGMNRMMRAFSEPMQILIMILEQLKEGRLDVHCTIPYKGAYLQMQDALNASISAFNSLLGNVKIAASEVSAGAKQVSGASQTLSQTSAEQASAVEQVTTSITELSAQTRENAAQSAQASHLASETKSHADSGNVSMQEMLEAIDNIGKSAQNISKIIKAIDGIAFQTNILALNAAVEAARAGQYGKGFSVVADEVRNLATKSANAAHETAELIETSVQKVKTGMEIAEQTAEKFAVITANTAQVANFLEIIGDSSNQQASAISQIDQAIQQIANSTQNNSATSEETAASSEELSGQAQTLLNAVNRFRLSEA